MIYNTKEILKKWNDFNDIKREIDFSLLELEKRNFKLNGEEKVELAEALKMQESIVQKTMEVINVVKEKYNIKSDGRVEFDSTDKINVFVEGIREKNLDWELEKLLEKVQVLFAKVMKNNFYDDCYIKITVDLKIDEEKVIKNVNFLELNFVHWFRKITFDIFNYDLLINEIKAKKEISNEQMLTINQTKIEMVEKLNLVVKDALDFIEFRGNEVNLKKEEIEEIKDIFLKQIDYKTML